MKLLNFIAALFREFWTKVKIDWQEWRGYKTSIWNVKRDKKAIERAIYRGKLKNQSDGRTYYILRNLAGGFDEVSSHELKALKARKIKYFPRYRSYEHMISQTFAIVTSNETQRKSYVEAVKNIQSDELKSLQDENNL
jgi:hypothetical protein